jgi:hypothetical protein
MFKFFSCPSFNSEVTFSAQGDVISHCSGDSRDATVQEMFSISAIMTRQLKIQIRSTVWRLTRSKDEISLYSGVRSYEKLHWPGDFFITVDVIDIMTAYLSVDITSHRSIDMTSHRSVDMIAHRSVDMIAHKSVGTTAPRSGWHDSSQVSWHDSSQISCHDSSQVSWHDSLQVS